MKKRIIYIIAAIFTFGITANAKNSETIDSIAVKHTAIERHGKFLTVDFTLDLSQFHIKSNRAVLFTPQIINNADTLSLPAVGVYGRHRYYYYQRQGGDMISGNEEKTIRYSKHLDTVSYTTNATYADWMNGSSLYLNNELYGCCKTKLHHEADSLAEYHEVAKPKFTPEYLYQVPERDTVKHRSISGSAFIDFPVNKTEIDPTYRNNSVELNKIYATIDSIRDDKDVHISSLTIKGFASPEGKYENNSRLASSRTESLAKYIYSLYHFKKGFIITDFEPEDWVGLRRYVEESNFADKRDIIALIDSDREPDNKEYAIRTQHSETYTYLLRFYYPALRRADYKVDYTVRHFTNPKEILRIAQTEPSKLSLDEFFIAAKTLDHGSDEFNLLFETAVHMFPDDPTANINAANAAMQRGDLVSAKRYIAKIGDSPEAIYARAIYLILTGDNAAGETLLRQIEETIPQAASALKQVEAIIKHR